MARTIRTKHYVWKDMGWQNIKAAWGKPTGLKVGVLEPDAGKPHPNSNLTIGEVALVNEFGSDDGHVPERAAFRNTVTRERANMLRVMARAVSRNLRERLSGNRTAMTHVGTWMVGKIREAIEAGVPPPNAPETIRKKKHGMTLRETFTLVNSISFAFTNDRTNRTVDFGGEDDE